MTTESKTTYRRHTSWIELLDPEKHYPVLEVLSSFLTIADFLVLCQACKGFGKLKKYMLKKVSNINVWLSDFVDDAAMFRSQLGSCGALISGAFALNIQELGQRHVPHLDVFVRDGTNADQFMNHIRETENYQEDNQGVETVQTHSTYSCSTRPGMKLRITRTRGPLIQAILTSSYTTASINLLTWNKAYSIFPRQTLVDHQFYPLVSLDDNMGSHLNELAQHAWTTRDIVWPDFAEAELCKVEGLRRVGDHSSLIISLNTDSVQAPLTPDFVIEYAQFEISGRVSRHNRNIGGFNTFNQTTSLLDRFLKIQAQEVASVAVRHGYTTGSAPWRTYLTERLQRWAWLELYKLKPENRPFRAASLIPLISDLQDFEVTQSWDYADDQIPLWYRKWEQMRL